jgi:hypothetical protein
MNKCTQVHTTCYLRANAIKKLPAFKQLGDHVKMGWRLIKFVQFHHVWVVNAPQKVLFAAECGFVCSTQTVSSNHLLTHFSVESIEQLSPKLEKKSRME